MNKRIHELAEQAELVSKQQNDGEVWRWGFMAQDLKNILFENFAELIVQECLMKVRGAKIRNESYTELIERIKEDFGVE